MTALEQLTKIEDQLEALIDSHGLYNIAQSIAVVCHGKSDHLQTNWQDLNGAKRWTRAAVAFERLEAKLHQFQEGTR